MRPALCLLQPLPGPLRCMLPELQNIAALRMSWSQHKLCHQMNSTQQLRQQCKDVSPASEPAGRMGLLEPLRMAMLLHRFRNQGMSRHQALVRNRPTPGLHHLTGWLWDGIMDMGNCLKHSRMQQMYSLRLLAKEHIRQTFWIGGSMWTGQGQA